VCLALEGMPYCTTSATATARRHTSRWRRRDASRPCKCYTQPPIHCIIRNTPVQARWSSRSEVLCCSRYDTGCGISCGCAKLKNAFVLVGGTSLRQRGARAHNLFATGRWETLAYGNLCVDSRTRWCVSIHDVVRERT
jgi:hypothetical protein